MENANKILGFIKSLFLPRRMVTHMNMRFILSLLLLMLASCLNIVTSNTRASKDAEKILSFPSLYLDVTNDFKVTNEVEDKNLPLISIDQSSDKKIKVMVDGKEQEVSVPYTHLNSDDNGVYHNVFTANDKNLDVTVVVEEDVYASIGTIESPISLKRFDLEGYFKQDKIENTEYLLYVFTLDGLYFSFSLDQIDENGQSVKAINNSFVFECRDDGALKYFLPASVNELKINSYGDFDTTLWTKEVSVDDQNSVVASTEHYNELVSGGLDISYEQYTLMVSNIKPVTRHLKNLSNALYGDVYFYHNLESDNFSFESINTSIKDFNVGLKAAMIEFNAGMLKTSSLLVSIVITLLFPFFLAGVTWLLSKNFYMNKFRQYYAIAALCFSMTTIIALIAGFFVSYTNMAFALLVIASVYYIVATFRINTIYKEEEDDDPKPNHKKPIKYSKLSDDTSIVG